MNRFLSSRRVLLFAAAGGAIRHLSASGAAPERLPAKVDGHSSNLMARVELRDGTTRIVTLQGVGCPVSLCSRVAIRSNTAGEGNAPGFGLASVWIDTIAAIRDTAQDGALFVMKDGAQLRLAFQRDFRVLYFSDQTGRAGKMDLAKVESLEFLTPSARN